MDINKLEGVIPDNVFSQIFGVMETFQINTPLRMSHFLAQCAHESGNFKTVSENLNYVAKGVLRTFKKYFPTEAKALQYERNPEKIANLVYANRMGNGTESSGDGFKYRGRGYIQLTGKINYKAFDKLVVEDIIVNPSLVATKYPLLSAAWFWNSRALNSLADKGATDVAVILITKKVNGGVHGLNDRLDKFKKFYSILN
jgi:putative chitinase